MPKIQRAQISGAARPTSELASSSAVTAVSRAASQAGGVIGNIGAQITQRKTDSDNAAYITERSNRVMREESEKLQDAETRGIDIDLKKNQEEWDTRLSTALEGAPSQEAQNALKANLDNAYNKKFLPGYGRHQAKMNVRKRTNAVESALDDIQSEVLTGRTGIAEALARSEAAIVGLEQTSGGVIDTNKLRKNNSNNIAMSVLGNRIEKGQGGSVIQEIKAGKWDKMTDSGSLSRVLRAAQTDVKHRSAAAKTEFTKGFKDYVSFVSSGQEDEAMNEKFSKEGITANFGKRAPAIIEALDDAKRLGEARNEIATASPEEISTLIAENKPKNPENFIRESAQFNALNTAINQRNKAISKDPAKYVTENSGIADKSYKSLLTAIDSGDPQEISTAASAYTSIQRSAQEGLGLSSNAVSFLPKPLEQMVTKKLNDFSKGGEDAALQLSTMKESFGDEWGQIQKQLVNSGNMSEGFTVAAGMDFGSSMINVMEATSIKQSAYKEVIDIDDFKDIKAEVKEELSDFQDTLRGQPSGDRVFVEHKNAIESLAMKYIADGKTSSTSDAIEKARTDVLDSRFSFVDSYRVPQDHNPDDISSGIEMAMDEIKEGNADLLIPFSSSIENEEDVRSVFLDKLKPTPITDPNGDGIMFVDQNGNAVLGADGQAFVKTWLQLERAAFDKAQEREILIQQLIKERP